MSRARDIANLQSGGVINDGSADLDFRIESNGLTHALFVDGGTDTVMIGTSSTDAYSSADNLVVGTGSGHNGMTVFSANDSQGTVFFADALGGDSDASTYDGYIIYDHDARHFRFGTAGTEGMRIDSSNRVLIGTTTEGEATADNLTIADTGHCGITIRSGDDDVGTIFFSDATSGTAEYVGYVQYDHSGNFMKWQTNGAERMRIDSSGNVGIGTNSPSRNLTVSSSSQTDLAIVAGTSSSAQLCFGDSGDDNIGQIEYNNSSNYMAFYTNAGERLRVTSSGSVLVGKTTSADNTINGVELTTGTSWFTATSDYPVAMNREGGSDGPLMKFYEDATQVGLIGSLSDSLHIGGGDVGLGFYQVSDAVVPLNPADGSLRDDAIDLGLASSGRFDDIHATNGTIQTSDENEKQDIASMTTAELAVGKRLSALFKTFRWKSKVTAKADKARTHSGIIAQQVKAAFEAESLDATKYALFCSNTWWEKEISVDAIEANEEKNIKAQDAYTYMDVKTVATEGYTEKTRMGIRYPELLSFVASYNESRFTAIEARIAKLEE